MATPAPVWVIIVVNIVYALAFFASLFLIYRYIINSFNVKFVAADSQASKIQQEDAMERRSIKEGQQLLDVIEEEEVQRRQSKDNNSSSGKQ